MSTVPWWVNAISGLVCFALGINFIAQAYGLRLGGKPLDTTTLPVYKPEDIRPAPMPTFPQR